MADVVRREVIAGAHTVVVKVGTNVLARPDGTLDPARFSALADQIQRIRQSGRRSPSSAPGPWARVSAPAGRRSGSVPR